MSVIKYESWDGVTAPAIPAGWNMPGSFFTTSSPSGGITPTSSPNVLGESRAQGFPCWGTADGVLGNVSVQANIAIYNPTLGTPSVGGVFARSSANPPNFTTTSFYSCVIDWYNARVALTSVIDGVETTIATVAATLAQSAWYTLTLECNGSTLTVVVVRMSDGLILQPGGGWDSFPGPCITATDSTVTGSGFAGIRAYTDAQNIYFDDWYLSSITSTPPVLSPFSVFRPIQGTAVHRQPGRAGVLGFLSPEPVLFLSPWSVFRPTVAPAKRVPGRAGVVGFLAPEPITFLSPWSVFRPTTAPGRRQPGRAGVLGFLNPQPITFLSPWSVFRPTVAPAKRVPGRAGIVGFLAPEPITFLSAYSVFRPTVAPAKRVPGRAGVLGFLSPEPVLFLSPWSVFRPTVSPAKRVPGRAGVVGFLAPEPITFLSPWSVFRPTTAPGRRRPGKAGIIGFLSPPLPNTAITYLVYANTGIGDPINYLDAIASLNALTFSPAPLTPGVWKFGIRAANVYGIEQNLDAALTITIGPEYQDWTNLPAPPTAVRALPVYPASIKVEWAWAAKGTPPTGFHVYATPGARLSYTLPTATVPWGAGFMQRFQGVLSGLASGPWVVGVRSYNSVGEEGNTVVASATVPAAGPSAVDAASITPV